MKTCSVCVSDYPRLFKCPKCEEACCKNCWSYHLDSVLKSDCMFCKEYIPVKEIQSLCSNQTYSKICKGYWDEFVSNISQDIENKLDGSNVITPKQYVILKRLQLIDQIYDECKFRVDGKMVESSLTYNVKCSFVGCIGIIVNGICIKCNVKQCTECDQAMYDGHMCKQSDLETKKNLDKITYKCPNCNIRFVSDGCSSNYCIACKTYFNRDTRKISKIPIHTGNTPEQDISNLYSGDFSEIIETLPDESDPVIVSTLMSCRNLIREYMSTDILDKKKQKYLEGLKLRFYKGNVGEAKAISKYIDIKDLEYIQVFSDYFKEIYRIIDTWYIDNDTEKMRYCLQVRRSEFRDTAKKLNLGKKLMDIY